jgi:hypothetical protein
MLRSVQRQRSRGDFSVIYANEVRPPIQLGREKR